MDEYNKFVKQNKVSGISLLIILLIIRILEFKIRTYLGFFDIVHISHQLIIG